MIWTFFVAAVCLLCLAAVWRIERAGAALLITPFLWFMILEALLVWPAVVQENVTSGFDPYVLLLAAAAVLSFMLAYGGFLLAAKHRREDLAAFQQAPLTPLSERHVFITLLTVAFL